MTEPATFHIEIDQGTDYYLWFATHHEDGTVENLATSGDGYTLGWLQVRDKHRDEGGELILNLTNDNGGVVIAYQADDDGEYWSGYAYISAAASDALLPFGDAVYELRVGSVTGRRRPLLKGQATLYPATVDEDEA